MVTIEAIKVAVTAPENGRIFYPEGGQQEYSVPEGAKHLEVLGVGGAGGDGESVDCDDVTSVAGEGGGGARVNTVLNVSAGEKLYVDFGTGGRGGHLVNVPGTRAPGVGTRRTDEPFGEPNALLSQLVLAGGGGGGGGGNIFPGVEDSSGGVGGSASGLVGQAGGSGFSTCCGASPGGGGGNSETGEGGRAGAEGSPGASAGGFAYAGNGGEPSRREYTTGGGGGGDGYYGGGGGECGGAGVEEPEECDKAKLQKAYAAGGGGAGSSFVTTNPARVAYVSYETGLGERQHMLIRPVAAPPTVTVKLAALGEYQVGKKGTATVVCEEEATFAVGIESCAGGKGLSGTVVLNTNFAGEYSFTARAVSKDGAVTEKKVTYTVYNPLSSGVSPCNGITGGAGGEVLVPAGARCTLIAGTHVSDQVRVEPGGWLIDSGASIGSNLIAEKAAAVQVGGSQPSVIGGSVELEHLAGTVEGAQSFVCNATIGANLKVDEAASRTGAISLGADGCSNGDSIHRSLTLSHDASAISLANTNAATVAIERNGAAVAVLAGKASKAFTIARTQRR